MATREFKGNAVVTTLTGGISPSDTVIPVAASTNWPSGTGAKQFVVLLISEDGATREKVLCESRTGLNITVATSGRGFDGTAASSFITGATCIHVADATWMQAIDDHVHDGSDDHVQYLNAVRHADSGLHEFGAALAEPDAPVDIGSSSSIGTSGAPAHGDHRHQLGSGCIDSSVLFADDVIPSSALPDSVIVPGHLASTLADGTNGIDLPFGVLRVKVDGTTCQLNASGEIEVLGGVVSTGGIADNAITLAKMADASVGTVELIDASVTTAKLVDLSVTTGKLALAAVTFENMEVAAARGLQGISTPKTTSQTGITTEVPVSGVSVTSQPDTATRYRRVHFRARNVESSVITDNVLLTAKRGATIIGSIYVNAGSGGIDAWFEDDDAPIAAHVYTVTVQRTTGTGTIQVDGSVNGPVILEVWDVGGH
jgi:hypothetical protein